MPETTPPPAAPAAPAAPVAPKLNFAAKFAEASGFNTTTPPPAEPTKPVEAAAPPAPAKPALPVIGKPAEPKKEPQAEPMKVEPLTDEPPQGVSPKSADDWKKFRQKANDRITAALEYQKKFEAAQQELETLKKAPQTPQVPPEFETIKKEREDLSNELKRVALARHPDFKKHFEVRFNSAVELAKEAVGKEKAEAVAKLFKHLEIDSTTEKLEELAGELTPLKAGQLANAVTAYRAAMQEREGLLAKAETELQAADGAEQQRSAKAQEQFQQRTKQVTEQALQLASTLDAFTPKDGDEAHNAAIESNKTFVRDFFNAKLGDEIVPWVPALAAEALHLKQTKIPALEAEINKRDEIIASYTKGTPRVQGDGGGKAQGGEKKGFLSAWRENAPQ